MSFETKTDSYPAATIREIEALTSRVWPPAQEKELTGWKLAIDAGVTRRANSVLPNHWTEELRLDTAIDEVERVYSRHGLCPSFKITSASLPSDLDEALEKRGYHIEGQTNVLVISPQSLCEGSAINHRIHSLSKPDNQWMHAAGLGENFATSRTRRNILERIGNPRVFLMATEESEPVGAAVVSAVDGWSCISGLHVSPEFRGKGIGGSLLAALAEWAIENGTNEIFLQVERDNPRAQALYERVGWRFAYGYHYRVANSES